MLMTNRNAVLSSGKTENVLTATMKAVSIQFLLLVRLNMAQQRIAEHQTPAKAVMVKVMIIWMVKPPCPCHRLRLEKTPKTPSMKEIKSV